MSSFQQPLTFPCFTAEGSVIAKPMPNKVLIVGTARSGTQWLTKIVRSGLDLTGDTCTHEPIHWASYRNVERAQTHINDVVLRDEDEFYVEVNCYATEGMPYWHVLKGRIFHVVRHPVAVARSLVRTQFNRLGLRWKRVIQGSAVDMGYMDLRTALYHWAEQHLKIMQWPNEGVWRIEDLWADENKAREFIEAVAGEPLKWGKAKRKRMKRLLTEREDKLAAVYPKPDDEELMVVPGFIWDLAESFGYPRG